MSPAPAPPSLAAEEQEGREEDEELSSAVVKKPVSAFLHYCAEQRPAVKKLMPNASAGDITKAISESWRALSEDDKKKFVDLATADKDRYERERGTKTSKSQTYEAHETVIPIGRVKKIAKLDLDVKSVSKEATAVIAKMTELFVAKLALETHVASSGKKVIKASDVAYCVHNRPAFAWLRADYPLTEYAHQPKAPPKALKRPENTAAINSFFMPATKKLAVEDDHPHDDNVQPDADVALDHRLSGVHGSGLPPDTADASLDDDDAHNDTDMALG